MTDSRAVLLSEINAFCARHKIAASTLGLRAINNSKLHARLTGGGSVTIETAEKIRAFMAAADTAKAE